MASFSYGDYMKQQAQKSSQPTSTYTPTKTTATNSNVGDAFWINPYGKIIDIGKLKHIHVMVQYPEKFGFSRDEVKALFDKHGEQMGTEGKAREEMIRDAMDRGFIHIRLYPGKFWAINLSSFNRRAKKALSVWAETAMEHRGSGRYMKTRIYSSDKDAIVANPTVEELYYEMSESVVDGFKPMLVESAVKMENLRTLTFSEFLAQ